MIKLDPKQFGDFNAATSREWLETNGIGGYASGTVSGAHARRYHGHFVAAVTPPLERAVLLSKFEETLLVDGVRFELSSNQFPGSVHPKGFEFLTGFRLDPFPIWTYRVAGIEVERKLFMVYGENSTAVVWSAKDTIAQGRDVRLELRPLLALRDHHHLRSETHDLFSRSETSDGCIAFETADMPTLHLLSNADAIGETGYWYRNFEYNIEQERGFDHSEDLFQPCMLAFDLSQPATVIASTDRQKLGDVALLEQVERDRRSALIEAAGFKDEFLCDLVLAADQYLVKRGEGTTVIAGYHWFSDWGRDTMIALNGLTIATGRFDIAKSILTEFANHLSKGMLPNRFPDIGEEPEYNTVDATLWFFEATRAYVEKTNDYEFVRRVLYDRFIEIIDWHERGTRYEIRVDSDGMLSAGAPGVQLTWMDAKIGDWVVTPRTGKAVEIQALWYNALCVMADLAAKFADTENVSRFTEMARAACESFNREFWNEVDGCLYDVTNGEEKDRSIRPNQIFAVSLSHSMLDRDRGRKVVEKVQANLLTPLGLRSLPSADERYVGTYNGSPFDRDSAYHQGPVWGWLIGPFIEAYLKVSDHREKESGLIGGIRRAFEVHLRDAMLGHVSEIFDGDSPHLPRGCAAQAWSVAEILRVASSTHSEKSVSAGII